MAIFDYGNLILMVMMMMMMMMMVVVVVMVVERAESVSSRIRGNGAQVPTRFIPHP